MRKMEILAPVGGQEQLLAAVRCGANAVYLGAKGFNARRNAENFAETGLSEAVSYCHARGVRVYVTVNTLVMDDELPKLVETLREIAQSGADAVIVQDMAVATLCKTHCPSIELHASTQMTVHNAAGARQLRDMGFSRVVLARELSIDEIAAIHKATDLSLEVFVHGALCMSVSGACYLSSMIGGRSGNRGLCAQPCRLDFTSPDERGYALSLRDLSAFPYLEALLCAGVHSLKIEGRMKRPEYVAAAVTACRKALAGEPYDLDTLEAAFSRDGFTDGHLTGKRDLSMFGTRGHADVQASQRVQGSLAGLYRHEFPGVPVDMDLTLQAGMPADLVVSDDVNTVTVTGDVPQLATAVPTDEARAQRSLAKTGESPFFLRSLSMETDGTLMLPASALNAMRRDALSQLLAIREAPEPKAFVEAALPAFPAHMTSPEPALHVRFESAAQMWPGMEAKRIIVPIGEITADMVFEYGPRLVGEIPPLVFPNDEKSIQAQLAQYREAGLSGVLCHNLGAIRMAEDAGLTPHGGYGLNILNSMALSAYAGLGLSDATLSFELHAQKIRRIGGKLPRGILAYGLLPMMQLRACPAQTANGCQDCTGQSVLKDRMGASFPLLCHQRRYATLLNSVPLDLSGERIEGIDFEVLHFTLESMEECKAVYERFVQNEAAPAHRTRGLYHRTLQ